MNTRKLSWPDSPVTKLKNLWLHSLTESDRDYWRDQFESARANPELRQDLQAKYGLNLLYDSQLTRFRRWLANQDFCAEKTQKEAQKAAEDLAELQAQNLTGEQLRAALLDRMKARALVDGDFKLGAQVVNLDLRAESVGINQQKLIHNERRLTAQEKARADATAAPNCLTPEVLEKIERELNLM